MTWLRVLASCVAALFHKGRLEITKGLTAVMVTSVALGIGANTAIFRLIDAVMLKFRRLLACTLLAASTAMAQQSPIDLHLAKQYFDEAQAASRRDKGAVWTVELYGPILFADAETHAVVANQTDREGKLAPQGDVYVGKLPPETYVANTALQWAGVVWTMVAWPLPGLRRARVRLIMHECFHRIEPRLGLPASDSSNSQLDTKNGRIWLEMEWRALEHAMWSAGPARRAAVADALYFRAFRRSLFPGSAARENALELNEGLAEYTGVKLSTASPGEFAMVADATLREAPDRNPHFVRSFAYVSGPAYGFLLDAAGVRWRQRITPQSDLGVWLARAYGIQLPALTQAEALQRARAYDGDEVIALETRRDQDRQRRLAEGRKRFIDGAVLILPPQSQFSYGFDPNNVLGLDDNSTLYSGDAQVSDVWGILKVSVGFLVIRQAGQVARVQVPAPADATARPLKGDGWTLELAPGWTLQPGPRQGDFTLKVKP